jgi:hypothetical protein
MSIAEFRSAAGSRVEIVDLRSILGRAIAVAP